MLSYRHAYHAGNFADVFKHTVLVLLLEAMARKDRPFRYIDTHAGIGLYHLKAEAARKNKEHQGGIARLWTLSEVPPPVAAYLDAVRAVNPPAEANGTRPLRYYPGSPRIARHFLRARDRMVLSELHTSDAPLLRREFAGDPRVEVHNQDGYDSLRALLPPPERRGLTLIDPAFERADELDRMTSALEIGLTRFATGTFALWYPIMPRLAIARFHARIAASGIRRVLVAELAIYPDDNPLGLNGAGLLIVNPPYLVDTQITEMLPWLWQVLSPDAQGRYRCDWLVGE